MSISWTPGDATPPAQPETPNAAYEFLRAHVANSPLAVIHWDSASRITTWNARAEAIFGWTFAEVAGKTMLEFPLIHPDDVDAVMELGRKLYSGEESSNSALKRNYTKDGEVVHCHWYNSIVRTGSTFSVLSLVEDVTEHHDAQQRLHSSEQSFRALFEHNPDSVCSIDIHGRVVAVNAAAERITGYNAREMIGAAFAQFFAPEDLASAYQHFATLFKGQGETFEVAVRHKDGRTIQLETTTVPVVTAGKVTGAFAVCKDVTDKREAERALHEHREQVRRLCEVAADPAEQPAKHIEQTLRLGLDLFGLDVATVFAVEGHRRGLLHTVVNNSGASLRIPETLVHATLGALTVCDSLPRGNGFADPRTFIGAPIDVDGKRHGVLCFAGPRERKTPYSAAERDLISLMASLVGSAIGRGQAQHRLKVLAFTDALTGLPNRVLFLDRLAQALAIAKRNDERLAVMFLDLDHFKDINDSLGHAVGDVLLKAVGERLRRCLRQSDTVARMGGDEFIILVPDMAGAQDVVILAEKILETIAAPYLIDEREHYTTASIGVSLFPSDGGDPETLVKHADISMYRAKERGRNAYTFFTPALDTQIASRAALEARLRRAVAHEEFEVFYQPIIDVRSGRLAAVEALLRWNDPIHGLIMPDHFIGNLESTGLIVPAGMMVLRAASRQMRAWQDAGLQGVRLAVNLSARQLHNPAIVDEIAAVIAAAGLDPRALELEITETVAMSDATQSIEVMRALKELGVAMSVDDFGTGYSSLSYLRRFPLDKLKIDRSFIHEMARGCDEATIVSTVVGMAHSLQLRVVAEGVENTEQYDFLRELDCDEVQGHLFSPALRAAEFATACVRWLQPEELPAGNACSPGSRPLRRGLNLQN